MEVVKHIALVAHDHQKHDLVEWVKWNHEVLSQHTLVCTGTTGRLVEESLSSITSEEAVEKPPVEIIKLKSGPLGGDQQLGAMIAEGRIDFIIFFWDPMEPHPHDVDVKALLRIAVVYNIPTACNRATADYMISSPLMNQSYAPIRREYDTYLDRPIVAITD
ncbi:MAG: methylglyoxal synthase [Anaerolineae bacterium]|nr:methylglyoxal synthase [Anaerolineae bacterium]